MVVFMPINHSHLAKKNPETNEKKANSSRALNAI
jgi:hypothetical protein